MASLSNSRPQDSAKQVNEMRFHPIEKTTIPGEIIDQIFSMLIIGKLKAGDKLPPERQLCQSLNVGRGSVREALKALEILGIIRRDVRGTTVCAPEENRYPGLWLAAGNASLEQVLEAARMLGIEAAGLAAERASQKHIERMVEAFQESEDTEKAAAVPISFIRALVDAAQNPVLSQLFNMLMALLAQSRQLSFAVQSAVQSMEEAELRTLTKDTFDGLRRLLNAVESHNTMAARRSMKEHFERVEAMALKSEWRGNEITGESENDVGGNHR